jgi:hypothetical protein
MSTPHLSDEQLSAHLDSALATEEQQAADSHLATCAECAARIDLLRATSQAVATLPAEEMPRPLDLGFLHEGVRPAPEEPSVRGFVARVLHGRPPVWLPTAVAAAAVLVVAVNVAPRLVPGGGGASQTSTGLSEKAATGTDQQHLAPIAPSANQSPGFAAPGSTSQKFDGQAMSSAARNTVSGPDGSKITLVANPPSASQGQPTQVVLMLVGAPRGTSLAPGGMQLFVSQGANQARIAGSVGAGQAVKPGQELDLTAEWSAGAVSGSPATGSYTLIGRVFLSGGRVVEVPLMFSVGPG